MVVAEVVKSFVNCLNVHGVRKSLEAVAGSAALAESVESGYRALEELFDKTASVDADTKRLLLDQAFRTCLIEAAAAARSNKDGGTVDLVDVCVRLATLAIRCCQGPSPNSGSAEATVPAAAGLGLCSVGIPVALLTDAFDILPLSSSEEVQDRGPGDGGRAEDRGAPESDCERLFGWVESQVRVWRDPQLFFQHQAVKNNLLRLCNDLLRRLSRARNTVFCGRILLFLARFFPLSERSGLNVVSEFNLENTTVFDEENDEGNDDDEGRGSLADAAEKTTRIEEDGFDLSVDYRLYAKFWRLQDFFRNPTQCYDRTKWPGFSGDADVVLDTLRSFKLINDSGYSKNASSAADGKGHLRASSKSATTYFAKYLTNQNLLQLQLGDSKFRRFVLVQFLILFQYLRSAVKFKNESQVLAEEQAKWVTDAQRRVEELIDETHPDGPAFRSSVNGILQREQRWNEWKNEGCPPLTSKSKLPEISNDPASLSKAKAAATGPAGVKRPQPSSEDGPQNQGEEDPPSSPAPKRRAVRLAAAARRRKFGDMMREADERGRYLMGNAGLTKLWNLCPDNFVAASAPERDFLPSVEEYFSEAAEQLDPTNQVEDEYKKVNDGQWGWRALRLLAKKSPYFFTYGNNPIAKLPEYLESMLRKMTPNLQQPGNVKGTAAAGALASGGGLEDSNNSSGGEGATSAKGSSTENDEAGGSGGEACCTDEQLAKVAEKLGGDWAKLASKLGQSEEDVKAHEKSGEGSTDSAAALLMLKKWAKDEGVGATRDEIVYILDGLKMSHVYEGVFE